MYLKICRPKSRGSEKRPVGGLDFSERNLLCAYPPYLPFHVSENNVEYDNEFLTVTQHTHTHTQNYVTQLPNSRGVAVF
jgi:hypothetical protein